MAEEIQEIGREFVKNTIGFIDGFHGFRVFMDSYTLRNRNAIAIPVSNDEKITFDILMSQEVWNTQVNPARIEKRYFYCECKKREDAAQLKPELKSFLKNVLKATPHLPQGYDDCGFIFFHNKPFSVTQTDLHNVQFVMDLLNNAYQVNEIVALCGRVGMICIDDWLLNLTACGRQ